MSGMKLTDHGGYPASSDEAMRSRNKVMHFSSAEGSGHLGMGYSGHLGMEYPDTTEDIKRDQEHGDSKVKKHKMKTGYRY